ncbi:MAG: hypothetical protein SOV71_00315 [Anaerovoracaceae bacterium]|nr:hypothetical protein [Bacillota bacterium]MDY2669989.1 hypothetical protein [Anaerovoracaceae bacterium]
MAKRSIEAGSEATRKTAVKKTPAQKEKENKEKQLAALELMKKDRIREKAGLDDAAKALTVPDITGTEVIHKKFGGGKVTESNGKYFVAEFEGRPKPVKMKFPDAFDKGILTLKNEADSETIEKICEQFRNLDNRKEEMDKKIYDISAEMSRISL